MAEYLGDYPVNATVYFTWNTCGQDGASITRSTDGTLKIYKDNNGTERTSLNGVTQVEDFDSNTGVHTVTIDLGDNTDAGFYAAGHEYSVVMTGMVIDTKTVNAVIAQFSIERAGGILALLKNADYGLAQLVRSTTPANKLDVSATGEAGLDFDNTKNATSAKQLATLLDAAQTVTLGNVAHGGAGATITLQTPIAATVPDTQKVDLNTIKTRAVADPGSGHTVTFPDAVADNAVLTNVTYGLSALKALIDAIQADIGDASASTLGSLYAILGNAAATITSRLPPALTANSNLNASFAEIGTTALTAQMIAAWVKLFDVASSSLTTASKDQTGDAYVNTQSILAKFGAITGSGWNTILGYFRAMLRKDVGVTLPSDIGGTFSNVTDSLEAIADAAVSSSDVSAIKGVTDKLDTMIQADGDVYQYTANALENGVTLTVIGGTVPRDVIPAPVSLRVNR